MKIFSNIRLVLSFKKYFALFIVFTVLFWALFGYLLGLDKLPLLDLELLSNSIVWELFLPNLFFILFAGTLNALLLVMTIFRLKELRAVVFGKEAKAGLFGLGLTGVFAACPFCAISVASVFGVTFVSNFIAPFYLEFQLVSLAIVTASLWWTSQKIGEECETCKIKPK